MQFKFTDEAEARSAAFHLRTAAQLYRKDAEETKHLGTGRTAEQFTRQADQAEAIAARIIDLVG